MPNLTGANLMGAKQHISCMCGVAGTLEMAELGALFKALDHPMEQQELTKVWCLSVPNSKIGIGIM